MTLGGERTGIFQRECQLGGALLGIFIKAQVRESLITSRGSGREKVYEEQLSGSQVWG